jgi:NCS1 family nucleobase:cation symporter-1
MGGMIAAVGSVLLTPWNWYNDPDAIFWTLGILGALIGPLFGILIADYYLVRKQHVVVDDLFTLEEDGEYWYSKGYNPAAVKAVVISGALAILSVVIPKLGDVLTWVPDYSWFLGCGLGFTSYLLFARMQGLSPTPAAVEAPAEVA